jgi:hypothetical protein
MSGYIRGIEREQMSFSSLDNMVDAESMARVIDLFVETLDMDQLGFERSRPAAVGRPGYPPQAICKLYIRI